MTIEDDYLYVMRRVSDRYRIHSTDFRPCVARMLNGEILCGGHQPRAWLVAVDLRFMNPSVDPGRIEEILAESGICEHKEIKKTVKGAFREKWNRWACHSETMHGSMRSNRDAYCVGIETCTWLNNKKQGRAVYNKKFDGTFEAHGWHHIISPGEYVLYQKIRELETVHRSGIGSLILCNHDRLAFNVGCNPRSITNHAQSLQKHGLIAYKPGSRGDGKTLASEFKRILPAPIPGPEHERKLKHFNKFKFGSFPE